MLRYTYRELTTFSLVMLLMMWAFYLLDSVHTRWVEGRVRAHVAEQLVQRGVRLSNTLNGKISLLYGMRSFVEIDPSEARLEREFPYIAATLRGNSGGIRCLQLVHDGVISHVWPEEGNEAVIGYDLLADPRPSVPRTIRKAMASDGVTFNGPLELKQGGRGLIARLPIQKNGETWGLAAVVIDLEQLMLEAEVTSRLGSMLVSVRDPDKNIFYGDPEVFKSAPAVQRIPLIDGFWELAAVPSIGWSASVSDQVNAFRIAGGIIILLLLSLFVVSTRNKYVLSRLVESRTGELRTLNTELQQEIDARKRTEKDLITARDKAEHSERLKDAFISSMSHEIRTPLHVILGYVELLRAPDEEIGHDKDAYIDSMRNAGGRLMRTVEEVLHISSLRAGTFQLSREDIDIVRKTKDVMQNYHQAASDRGLGLVFRSRLLRANVHADRYCVDQILHNLLDNAIKYTEKGNVEVSIDGNSNSCTLQVKDSGIGISEEYLKHAFDVFSQEQIGYSRPYEGIGLGLALTREYIQLHGGEIDVHSEKGVGSVFTVTLPATATTQHAIPEEEWKKSRPTVEAPSLRLIRDAANVA
ncbi:CHASE domain-containing protein [bacterium]|nr:CHASE domain-containing protein [bacterium]